MQLTFHFMRLHSVMLLYSAYDETAVHQARTQMLATLDTHG